MSWNNLKLPAGSKLFKIHRFNFMFQGVNYKIEVDEFHDGRFAAHAEDAADQNYVIESVSGNSVEECLTSVIERIQKRSH